MVCKKTISTETGFFKEDILPQQHHFTVAQADLTTLFGMGRVGRRNNFPIRGYNCF
jgi:hypothetical protein